jgi:hypothetical protein
VTGPTQHQNYGSFPRLGVKFVDSDGNISIPWYRLLVNMWTALGKSASQTPMVVFLQQTAAGIQAFASATGALLGTLAVTPAQGGPAVPLAPGVSPWVYPVPGAGVLVAFACQIEFSRDGGVTWFPVTLTGGAVACQPKDQVRLTWFQGPVPQATWFPNV